jgi:hypothetical protein
VARPNRKKWEVSALGGQHSKRIANRFEDISHYFLSAAEADASKDATEAAGHLTKSNPPNPSDSKPASSLSSSQPVRRKENCASCAHLIVRVGQPFQCRIFSAEHSKYKVEHREKIELNEGRTCPYFMRVTSKQIEDILRSHGSSLSSEQVRDYPHRVDEQIVSTKTITISPSGGLAAEEVLREELLRYLVDGYSIIEATVSFKEDLSDDKRSKSTTRKIRLRVKQDG